MADPAPAVQAILKDVDWDALSYSLESFAHRLVYGRYIPGGWSPEDLVQNAVAKLLAGKRRWNPNMVDLWGFLCGIIRSDLSHALTKAPLEHGEDSAGSDGRQDSQPHNPAIQVEYEQQRRALLDALPHDLRTVAAVVIDEELFEPRDIAQRLGMSRTDIYNAQKRLRRILPSDLVSKARRRPPDDGHNHAPCGRKAAVFLPRMGETHGDK